jgi:hypothetical protein
LRTFDQQVIDCDLLAGLDVVKGDINLGRAGLGRRGDCNVLAFSYKRPTIRAERRYKHEQSASVGETSVRRWGRISNADSITTALLDL